MREERLGPHAPPSDELRETRQHQMPQRIVAAAARGAAFAPERAGKAPRKF
jgi:hypothetical protein